MKNYFRTIKIPSHSFFPTASGVSPRKDIERPVNASMEELSFGFWIMPDRAIRIHRIIFNSLFWLPMGTNFFKIENEAWAWRKIRPMKAWPQTRSLVLASRSIVISKPINQ